MPKSLESLFGRLVKDTGNNNQEIELGPLFGDVYYRDFVPYKITGIKAERIDRTGNMTNPELEFNNENDGTSQWLKFEGKYSKQQLFDAIPSRGFKKSNMQQFAPKKPGRSFLFSRN